MSNNIVPIGENKSQKPSNSAFKQQKLSAWQPILTAGTVLPTFFLIGVAFIPVGIGLLISSFQVQEHEIDYTTCKRQESNETTSQLLCSEFIAKNPNQECVCHVNFTLENDFRRDVFIYYGLINFYQNHRRYVKSRDDRQLLGKIRAGQSCEPFRYRKDPSDGINKIIMPCGAIANSYFSDQFTLERLVKDANNELHFRAVPFHMTGISWATDKKNKFRNPPFPPGSNNLALAFNGTIKPKNWEKPIYELDEKDSNNNGLQNEGLIVWMRTAAFPTFRKVYARIAHDKRDNDVDYQDSLPKGDYRLTINYTFPVAEFKGKKRFIISNTSWLGGRNPFIGAVYIFVGIISMVLSAVFLLIHKKYNKHPSETLNITSQTPFIVSS